MVDRKRICSTAVNAFLRQGHPYPLVAHKRPRGHRAFDESGVQSRPDHVVLLRILQVPVMDCHLRHSEICIAPEKQLRNRDFGRSRHGSEFLAAENIQSIL